MKVVSGYLKGRNLLGYDIKGTRPTMDRVKESLFATIQNYIDGSRCLDLFSGSGNLGIEAISEGASKVVLVDNNYIAIKTIKENVEKLGITENVDVIKGDFKQIIKTINDRFDIIFLDPPYDTNYIEISLKLILENDILHDNGIIVCESNSIDKIKYSNKYILLKQKKYGDKYIEIIKKVC